MELIPIVDQNDTVRGYKNRSKIKYKKDTYRASALIIYNKNQILIAQRSFTKNQYSVLWAISYAGTVPKGEGYKETIYREAYEELEIIVVMLKPFFMLKFNRLF